MLDDVQIQLEMIVVIREFEKLLQEEWEFQDGLGLWD